MWLNDDEEVDMLYVHFTNEVNSTHSEMREDGVIFDYKGKALVGITYWKRHTGESRSRKESNFLIPLCFVTDC
jgi:hypothetical protein